MALRRNEMAVSYLAVMVVLLFLDHAFIGGKSRCYSSFCDASLVASKLLALMAFVDFHLWPSY